MRSAAGLYAGDWFLNTSGTDDYEEQSLRNKMSLFIGRSFFDERISFALKTSFNPFAINRECQTYGGYQVSMADTLFRLNATYFSVMNRVELSVPVDVPVYEGFFIRAEPTMYWHSAKTDGNIVST